MLDIIQITVIYSFKYIKVQSIQIYQCADFRRTNGKLYFRSRGGQRFYIFPVSVNLTINVEERKGMSCIIHIKYTVIITTTQVNKDELLFPYCLFCSVIYIFARSSEERGDRERNPWLAKMRNLFQSTFLILTVFKSLFVNSISHFAYTPSLFRSDE